MSVSRASLSSAFSSVVVRHPSHSHRGTLLWLHDLGGSSRGVLSSLEMSTPPWARLVIPQAPVLPVAALQNRDQSAWFNVQHLDPELDAEDNEELEGLDKSRKALRKLLDEEVEMLAGESKRIVVAGFRQGGAMAVHAGIRFPAELGGICSFNGFVLPQDIEDEVVGKTPVFAMNAADDSRVDAEFAEETFRALRRVRGDVEWMPDHQMVGDKMSHEALVYLAEILQSVDKKSQ